MRTTLSALALLGLVFSAQAEERSISSLGRLEPENGIVQLAGPSGSAGGAVLKTLEVAEGDWVEKDQVLARLDSYNLRRAEVARLEAILSNAQSEKARQDDLARRNLAREADVETAETDLNVAIADLDAARANLDLALVRSPIKAQVLEIHAYPGERIGPEGIMELGRTDRMYAVAEVYETDITAVKTGQSATVRIPAMETPLTGTVDRISLKVGRLDVIGTDPISKTDARVVEVFILLDDGDSVAGFTNMQVKVEIQP